MSNRVQSALRAVAEVGVGLWAACNRLRLPGTANPFVVGVHEPMREELTVVDLPITGAIPLGLNGLYLKMGANPVRPVTRGHDWFLGDGMVHGLAIEDGRALWYRNRWIGSRSAAAALGRAAAPGPRRGDNDTVNTNVVEIGGRIFAVVEAGSIPVELSRTLEEQRYNPLDGTLTGSFTGHPHHDPSPERPTPSPTMAVSGTASAMSWSRRPAKSCRTARSPSSTAPASTIAPSRPAS